MKIIDNSIKRGNFYDVSVGSIFKCGDDFYLKCDQQDSAVRVSDGHLVTNFSKFDKVDIFRSVSLTVE